MGTNSKNYHDHQRTFSNNSPSNKKYSSQRPSPSKSINIVKTPNKNSFNVAGKNNYFNNNNTSTRLSLSGSPTTSYFAASKCFESPSPDSLPKPPATWFATANDTCNNNFNSTTSSSSTKKLQAHRVRKALIMPSEKTNSCAMEYAAFSAIDNNDHFTQNLKVLLNVNA